MRLESVLTCTSCSKDISGYHDNKDPNTYICSVCANKTRTEGLGSRPIEGIGRVKGNFTPIFNPWRKTS